MKELHQYQTMFTRCKYICARHKKTNVLVSDLVRHRPGCTATEDCQRLEISYLGCTIRVTKTKALISFAVTAKLICLFVFAYAKCWFSHDTAHIYIRRTIPILGKDCVTSSDNILVTLTGTNQ